MHSTGFDFQPRTRVVFGQDGLERVGELARDFGVRRVLLVTDKGIAAEDAAAIRKAGVELILAD